ncbi:hypothetical protein J40TS1_30470 [Paenibacillus montaniterrae]|uniref:HTH cro/C1-type domain-containing protein n=1 Tax=Paenibacillus montaniterrae TaxID=429341 RepID=A0A920CYH4_9BACL|nr:helix-turn-helix transcriptional regulator [Paenibacillus montaniterrae]GIP17405.1 hypothetical protein J40TS1_30470 [Paenibacillus montaniterrae]
MERTLAALIGAKIKMHRQSKGLTQERLAEAIGSTPSYIGRLERGEQNVKIQTIEKIADALEINASLLFSDENEQFLRSKKWVWESLTLLLQQSESQQHRLYRVLKEIVAHDEDK